MFRNMKKKKIQIVALAVVFSFSVLVSPRAYAWGDGIPGAILKQTLETIQSQIEGILLSSLKSTAMTLLNTRVAGLVGGTSAGTSKVISDWKQYLYQEPEERVLLAMDNFYSTTLRGRSSSSGYYTASGSRSYESYLAKRTREVLDANFADPVNLSEVNSDPIGALNDSGDIGLFSRMMSSQNDPFIYALRAQKYEMALREQYRREAEVQAAAYSGYRGVRDNDGNVILPGSTIAQMVADTENIGNNIIAAAKNPGELIGGVISGLANRMVTNLVQKGVGQVQASIQREIRNVDNQIMGQVTTVNRTLGQGAKYTTEIRQRTDLNLKVGTAGGVPPILDGR